MSNLAQSVGITSFTLEDEVYIADLPAFKIRGIRQHLRRMILGEDNRNWVSQGNAFAIFPYDDNYQPIRVEDDPNLLRWMWPYRTNLSNNVMFSGQTKTEAGLYWAEYGRLTASKLRTPLSITFAEVASHNHFCLDRGGDVFNRTAPVIKLDRISGEDAYLGLLGILNSSTACFWLRQKSKPKGGAAGQAWLRTYQFNSKRVAGYPVPPTRPVSLSRRLESLAQSLAKVHPSNAVNNAANGTLPSRDLLDAAEQRYLSIRAEMVSVQEELDWTVYQIYGLIDGSLTYSEDLPGIDPGERAFAIKLARNITEGEGDATWFTHKEHRHRQTVEYPREWPPSYRELVASRCREIDTNPILKLIERPEYKRRWESESWESLRKKALQSWLLSRLSERSLWFDLHNHPTPQSVAQLADRVARDDAVSSVLSLWEGRPDVPITQSLLRLVEFESAAFSAAYRYSDSGIRTREAWKDVWSSQRRKDTGKEVGWLTSPPDYQPEDFQKKYVGSRGKLDVPKERFILYPDASRQGDSTPLLGWAGWDHAEQALALAAIISEREQEGWDDDAARSSRRRAGRAAAVGGAVAYRGDPGVRGELCGDLPAGA